MFLAFLIKHMCLLAFYFAYVSMIAVDLAKNSMLVYFLILISYSFSYALRYNEKYSKYKYIPVLGIFIALLFTRTVIGIIAVIIPYIYIIYLATKDKYHFNYYSFKDKFINQIFGIAPLLFFVIVLKIFELFKDASLKYVIVFLITGLYLLRTLRHTEEVVKSKKFVTMNISIITLTSIICIIFSSDVILNAIIYSLKSIYYNMISPMLSQILYYVLWPFRKTLSMTPEAGKQNIILESSGQNQGVGFAIRNDISVNNNFYFIVYIFAIVLFLFIAIILIIRFLSKRKSKEYIDAEGVKSYRKFVDVDKKTNTKGKGMYGKGISQIRYWYKKFLELCRSKEMSIYKYDSSKTIYEKSSEIFKNQENDLKSMQEIYRKARYSKDDVKNQDVKIIKGVYKSLEKEK